MLFMKAGAQNNFHKTYVFEDTFAIFNDIYVTDSCYYYTGTSGFSYRKEDFNFGKINNYGQETILLLHIEDTSLQRVMFSFCDTDTNVRGNFISSYVNFSATSNYPRIKEIKSNGEIINDFIIKNIGNNIITTEFSNLIINNIDSSYYISYTYKSVLNDASGVILFKVKIDGTVLFMKTISQSIQNNTSSFPLNLIRKSENELLLVLHEVKAFAPSLEYLNWSKTHFITLNNDGEELARKTFTDGQYIAPSYGTTPLNDGGYIKSYWQCELSEGQNNQYFKPNPVIARLDSNLQIIWKYPLTSIFGTDFDIWGIINDIKIYQDTLIMGAYSYTEEIQANFLYSCNLRLSQFTMNGALKWNRDYRYFPTDNDKDPTYGIYDFELTPDGGFIMAGEVINYDSLSANKPGQLGYVLKTNCLGFLGEPQANAFHFMEANQKAHFENKSIQAGSYTWDFGDGEQLVVSESDTSFTHQYTQAGIYQVMLIAHGCNGSADTLLFSIDTELLALPKQEGKQTSFSFFPNPTRSEQLACYIGNIQTDSSTKLVVYNDAGQEVALVANLKANSTHILDLKLASGTYMVHLVHQSKLIAQEKLVIIP